MRLRRRKNALLMMMYLDVILFFGAKAGEEKGRE